VRWITSNNWDNETPNNPIRGVNSIQLVNNGRSSNVGVVNPDAPTGYRGGRTAEDKRTVTTLTKRGLSRIVGKTLVELYDVEGRNLDVRTRRLFGRGSVTSVKVFASNLDHELFLHFNSGPNKLRIIPSPMVWSIGRPS
jgi:hypothetical protein